jgi:hypothetical protein
MSWFLYFHAYYQLTFFNWIWMTWWKTYIHHFFEKHTICNLLLFMKSLIQRNSLLNFHAYYQANLPQLNLNDIMKNLHSSIFLKNIHWWFLLFMKYLLQRNYIGHFMKVKIWIAYMWNTWHFLFLAHSLVELKTCHIITQLKKNTSIVLKLLYIVMCNGNAWQNNK